MRALSQPSRRGTIATLSRDRQVRQQAHLLDHVADAAPQLDRVLARHVLAADQDLARRRLDQPVDHAQGGRLAAARWADQHADLAGGHFQAQIVDGGGRRRSA